MDKAAADALAEAAAEVVRADPGLFATLVRDAHEAHRQRLRSARGSGGPFEVALACDQVVRLACELAARLPVPVIAAAMAGTAGESAEAFATALEAIRAGQCLDEPPPVPMHGLS